MTARGPADDGSATCASGAIIVIDLFALMGAASPASFAAISAQASARPLMEDFASSLRRQLVEWTSFSEKPCASRFRQHQIGSRESHLPFAIDLIARFLGSLLPSSGARPILIDLGSFDSHFFHPRLKRRSARWRGQDLDCRCSDICHISYRVTAKDQESLSVTMSVEDGHG